MSNVLQKAFYLARPRESACEGTVNNLGTRRFRARCGAVTRQRLAEKASASLIADWQAVLQTALHAAGAHVSSNVSSAPAKAAPLLRPAQSALGFRAGSGQQQS